MPKSTALPNLITCVACICFSPVGKVVRMVTKGEEEREAHLSDGQREAHSLWRVVCWVVEATVNNRSEESACKREMKEGEGSGSVPRERR
jgi:hypothetical protein